MMPYFLFMLQWYLKTPAKITELYCAGRCMDTQGETGPVPTGLYSKQMKEGSLFPFYSRGTEGFSLRRESGAEPRIDASSSRLRRVP